MGKMEDAVAFAVKALKKNPEITLAEAKKAAPKGITLYPVILSKARAELGIVASRGRKRGSKSTRKKAGASKATRTRKATRKKRGRRAAATSDTATSLQGIVDHMKQLESEVQALREGMRKIAEIAGYA